MKKLLLSIFLVVFLCGVVYARVTLRDANIVAENWLYYNRTDVSVDSVQEIVYKGLKVGYVARLRPVGFIIIPATDTLSPVKLWSRRGKFVAKGPILDVLNELYFARSLQLKAKENGKVLKGMKRVAAWDWIMRLGERLMNASDMKDVEASPLITSRWDQGPPYNNYVPSVSGSPYGNGRAPAGCVAIATAQIMRFYKCPINGVGSHAYKWHGQTLSANFEHSYDWLSMPDSLSGASSYQIDIVARAISDVGIAVNMDYNASGSAANFLDTVYALTTYFKYSIDSIDIISVLRDFGGDVDAYFDALRDERDAGRVVDLGIFGTSGGHAVVMDGYRIISLGDVILLRQVHLNMGWGGNYDDYYSLDFIHPDGMDFSNAAASYAVVGIIPTEQQGGGGGGGCSMSTTTRSGNGLLLVLVFIAAIFGFRVVMSRR